MLSYIKGPITEKNLDRSSFVVEANQIGYLIYSNLKFLNLLSLNQAATIYISEVIREDSHMLYGFPDKTSRDLFETLTSVSGLGPKSAMNILDILEISEIIGAVMRDQPKILASAQGIGLKTAQKAIIELKNKLGRFSSSSTENSANKNIYKGSSLSEANSILAGLGYSDLEIQCALTASQKAEQDSGQEFNLEALVEFAIQNLSKNLVR